MITKQIKQKKVIEAQPKLREITASSEVILKRVQTHLAALELYIDMEDSTLFDAIEARMRGFNKKVRARRKYWVNRSMNRFSPFRPVADLFSFEGFDA